MSNSITNKYNSEVFSLIHLLELGRFCVWSSGWTSSPLFYTSYSSTLIFLFSILILTSLRASCSATWMPRSLPAHRTDKVSVHSLLRTRQLAQQQRHLKLNSSLVTQDFLAIWNVKYRNVKKKKEKRKEKNASELKCVCRAHELVIVTVKARRIILFPFFISILLLLYFKRLVLFHCSPDASVLLVQPRRALLVVFLCFQQCRKNKMCYCCYYYY